MVPFRKLSAQRQKTWGLSLATVAFAGALLILLPAPEAAVATPGAAAPGAPTTPATPSLPLEAPANAISRIDLDGPGVDGSFALATRAVRAGAASELFAELRLLGLAPDGTRVPVSLAVVLDHSGSMSGEKIEQARESIVSLLAAMGDDDRLAVIVYDDTAELLQPLAPARVLRRSLPERVRRVMAEGGTNIPGGLALGIEALREAPEGSARRIILVSDGRDGSGVSLTDIASRVGASAASQVVTSSLGVGLDYDQSFMTSVADAGHGNYAFLERGEELQAFLRRELDETGATVAEAVSAEITLPAGVRLIQTHGAVAQLVGDRVRVELGSLFGGERRKVVFELESTGAEMGTTVPLGARLVYRSVAAGSTERPAHLASGVVASAVVLTDEEVEAAQDPELYPDALATILDAQQNAAMAAWRNGDRETAHATSVASLGRYRRAAARHADPLLEARMGSLTEEMDTYEHVDPSSAGGRAFDLGSGATRRTSAEAF